MWLLAWRNLARRRLRSTLTLLGVAIGISVVVALVGVADGAKAQMNRAMLGHRGDIVCMQRGARTAGRLTPADVAAVAAVPGVLRALPYDVLPGVEVGGVRLTLLAFPDPAFVEQRFPVTAGHAPRAGADEVMLGATAAEILAVGVGGTVTVADRTLTVVGTYRSGVPFQDRGFLLHLDLTRTLFNLGDNPRLALADVTPGEVPSEVAARIGAAVPAVDARAANQIVDSWEERRLVEGLVWAISVIALLAGSVGVLNTMSMSVLERTREIGLLLAIGWRPAKVLRLLVVEGTLLSGLGGLAGFGLGVTWVALARTVAAELTLEGDFGLPLLAEAMGLALGVGLAGSILPAAAAARLDPIEALRFE